MAADRQVTVRLRALVADYNRALTSAAAATASLGTSAKTAISSLTGQQMVMAGRSLTRNVTLPIAAIGVASVKMSNDFETSMSKIIGLVGLSSTEVDGMKESVLALAGETARSPVELADALFFITSAGLRGADALEALEFAAKGSAAGLGDTATVADTVTSAMNAYGSEALNAERATDILVGTVRAGKAEAPALASALGTVLPVASKLGVSFDDVGAALAAMTRTGSDASTAGTQLNAIMSALLKTTPAAERALSEVGLSSAGLRDVLREDDGLLKVLMQLDQSFGGNEAAMARVFPNVRALRGAFDLLGANVDDTEQIFSDMNDTAGLTEGAFATMAETMGFKNKQAFADLQVALIAFGDALAPIAADVLGFVGDIASAFSSLPGPVQTSIIAMLGIAAVAGPVLTVAGNIKELQTAIAGSSVVAGLAETRFAGLASTLGRIALRSAAYAAAFAVIGRGVSELTGIGKPENLSEWQEKLELLARTGQGFDLGKVVTALDEIADPSLAENIGAATSRITGFVGGLAGIEGTAERNEKRIRAFDQALADMVAGGNIDMAESAFNALMSAADEQGVSLDKVKGALPAYALAVELAGARAGDAEGPVDDLGDALDDQGDATADATKALEDYLSALTGLFDPLFAAQDALLGVADAQAEVTRLEEEGKRGTEEYDAAVRGLVRAVFQQDQAFAKLRTEVGLGNVSMAAAESQLREWVSQGHITADQARKVADELRGVTRTAQTVPKSIRTDVGLIGADAAERRLNDVARGRTASIHAVVVGASAAGATIGRVARGSAAGGLITNYLANGGTPVMFTPRGTDTVPAMLTPGEFVMRKSAVDQFGLGFMQAINSGNLSPADQRPNGLVIQNAHFGTSNVVPDMDFWARTKMAAV